MQELSWINEARKHIGLHEIKGKQNNPVLVQMLKDMGKYSTESKAWYTDDETPWCGLFVGHCLGVVGRFVVKNWFRASAWNDNVSMFKLSSPAYGCIVTFARQGGGHVGFVVGKDSMGNLMVLGGNQGDSVSIAAFAPHRATGFFWPSLWSSQKIVKDSPDKDYLKLPILSSNGKLSKNEA